MKILLSLVLAGFSAASFALTPANLYECTAPGITVTYTGTSLAGPPILTFTIGRTVYSGQGAEITDDPTVLGHLLTITKSAIPDLQTDTLTLVAPDVNVVNFGDSVEFDSRVFGTRTFTSIGGPQLVEGVIQNNKSLLVHCTATAAVF